MTMRTLYGVSPRIRVILLLAAGTLSSSYALAQTSSCHAADSHSQRTTTDLGQVTTSSKPNMITLRTNLQLAAGATVSYVTQAKTCRSAATALNTRLGTPNVGRSVYVWQVGTDYAVEDVSVGSAGEYRQVYIFDRRWAFKSVYLPF